MSHSLSSSGLTLELWRYGGWQHARADAPEGTPRMHPRLRGALLLWACLLLTPEFPLHTSLGLVVQWSDGLTLSNLLIPACGISVLAMAWLRGRRLFPAHGRLSLVMFAGLLLWGAVTWLPWLLDGGLQGAALVSVVAHWGKLLFIVALAGYVAACAARGRDRILAAFLLGMGINALIGLGQALNWFPVYSPLAAFGHGVRVTGTFYDANMYSALVALALVVCIAGATEAAVPPRLRLGGMVVGVALAFNLALTASRAGYLALVTALLVLALLRCWKPLAWILLAAMAVSLCFPARTMGRLRAALDPGPAAAVPDAAARARAESMHDSLYQYLSHPWLGLGFGRSLYLGVASRAGFDYAGAIPLDPRQDHRFTGAQNMFLTVLAETGPVGLLLYLAWLAAVFRPFLRSAWPARLHGEGTIAESRLARAMMAGLTGMVVASCTIELFLNVRVLGIVLVLAASWEAALHSHISHRHRPALAMAERPVASEDKRHG